MTALAGNGLIVQAGGPTAVINNTLCGIIYTAKANENIITGLYGSRFGFSGIPNEDFIDLYGQDKGTLAKVSQTPGAALGSARIDPSDDELDRAFDVFRSHNIRHIFYIGGDDSRKVSKKLMKKALEKSHEMGVYSVPKTIDNDLPDTHYCPGYPSAAAFVWSAMAGDDKDSKSFTCNVKVNVAMGRDWSWLAAAAGLAKKSEYDAPHVIVFSERPFNEDAFMGHVQDAFDKYGRADIVIPESLKKQIPELNKKSKIDQKDGFGHTKLHTPDIAQYMVDLIESRLNVPASAGKIRARGDVWGYLQRTFPLISMADYNYARSAGQRAVQCAVEGRVNSAIVLYNCTNGVTAGDIYLDETSPETRRLSDEFIGSDGISVSQEFTGYARQIIGKEINYRYPDNMGKLDLLQVEKKLSRLG